jgi:PAS domain S-box-containing protein
VRRAVADGNWSRLATIFSSRHTLQGGFAIATSADGRIVASLQLPAGVVDPGALNSPLSAPSITVGGVQYMIAREPVTASHPSTLIEVGMPVPGALTAKMAALKADSQRYQQLSAERRSLARLYTSYLLLLTLVILFAATWFALFLSKMVTLPIQALVTATQEISRGNLAHRIRVRAKDEIRDLVSSFNRMTGELEAGRAQLEASRQELRDANRELDRRRQYTETLLESIPSAVISVHADHSINRINPAVPRLFGDRTQRAQRLEDLFDNESAQQVDKLLRKSERLGPVAAQIEVVVDGGRTFTAAVTAAPIPSELSDEYAGYVLVLEDLSDVLRIQKIAAWREVAQRIAHEIRNPLTPIALSAQRARRRVEKLTSGSKPDGESLEVIQRCATLIESEVQTLQHLVDEFSMFARFPAPKPVVCDLNEVIQRALCVFDGRLDGVQIHTQFAAVPPLLLDEEGMKRVFVNLIDNAADAMRTSPFREITLSTNCSEGVVETVVADTGAGIKPADKERLFLPYFSTKKRGTGLGLAVVMRIVEEHGGSIRVEENQPVGTRFIIELPVTQPVHTAEGVTVA